MPGNRENYPFAEATFQHLEYGAVGKVLLISLNPQDQALLYYPGDTSTDPRLALLYRNIVVELIPNTKVSFLAKAAECIDFYDGVGKQQRKKIQF